MPKSKKDLPVRKDVKGGKPRISLNDNLTLARRARPGKNDLPAGKDIKGGKLNGGRLAGNDNLTLVRG